MRACLINPTVHDASTFPSGEFFSATAPNMGLAYIAAVVEQAGYDISILDANALKLSHDQVVEELRRLQPDVVGVTATTTTLTDALATVRAAREALPEVRTVMGGIHVSRFPEETLADCPELDIVCIGEGEFTWVELLEVLEERASLSKVKGIAYRSPRKGIRMTEPRPCVEDLDALPLPARHLLPLERYESAGRPHRTASIVSSRGCPFGCRFCAAPFIAGRRYRVRSAQSLLEEVDEIVNVYKMNTFEFVDDLFTLDMQRVMDFCEGLRERDYEVNWTCSARADTVTPEMLHAMAAAGCRIIYYGIESGSQRILDLVGKGETLEQMEQAVRWTREAGMRTWGFFIIGFPDETAEEIEATIAFAQDIELDYAEFFICSAFPGSPLYEHAAEYDLVEKRTWSDISYGNANIRNETLTPEELELYMIKGYRDFYTSPKIKAKLIYYGHEDMVREVERQTSERFCMEARVSAVISRLKRRLAASAKSVIPALVELQERFGYIPEEAYEPLSAWLGMTEVDIEGVASFYNRFKLNKPGRHSVKVCTGTACHVKGAQLTLDAWERELGIKSGQTTPDGEFDLESVACVGCCSAAPVVVVDGEVIAEMKAADVKDAVVGMRLLDPSEEGSAT